MPGYDRTGPKGMGPGSGGGYGRCGNNATMGCRRKGGAGQQKGKRFGFGQGTTQEQQMRRGFASPEALLSEEENNAGSNRFSGTKWFHRRNRT